MENKDIKFINQKGYKLLKMYKSGALGKTALIKDETIDEVFICKKYSPELEEHIDEYYDDFVNEIKLLYTMYSPRIVRVFNYYLYPNSKTGYILMEYIKGDEIDDYIKNNPNQINSIFRQVVEGFDYLHSNKILHRDIRPGNILVNEFNEVKIIDFGFGKQINNLDIDTEKSVSLNWIGTLPSEFAEDIYDYKTDVYFVGKLFKLIIENSGVVDFKHMDLLNKMVIENHKLRIDSFSKILSMLNTNSITESFSENQISIYRSFVNPFIGSIASIYSDSIVETNYDIIFNKLEKYYEVNQLEEHLIKLSSLIDIFINGNYKYYKTNKISVVHLKYFLKLLVECTDYQRKIIFYHISMRIFDLEVEAKLEDLPF